MLRCNARVHPRIRDRLQRLVPCVRVRRTVQEYEHWRVYDFITRHFLACCSKNAVGRTTSVTADMGGERFHASGLVVLERNFLDVYPFIRWNASALPNFQVGQTFVPTSVKLHEGNTQPPAPLAEHELIELMNANGIGTDATIPEHISKVQEREYVRPTRKHTRKCCIVIMLCGVSERHGCTRVRAAVQVHGARPGWPFSAHDPWHRVAAGVQPSQPGGHE
ncbi:hypothetical protein EON66_10445 [archaeon]|nr:MAG: hypothetical protein EON66_10445 [archaeon]